MRHRDRETVVDALEDWRALRKKIATEGGEHYEKPVLVKFLDTGTFEVMDRDIVEDEFYVLREHKILRDLAADGRDLEAAIREAGHDSRQKSQRPGQSRQGQPRQGQQRQGQQRQGQPREGQKREGQQREGQQREGQPREDGQPSQRSEKRGPRRGRRRGRRSGKRPPNRDRSGPPPSAA